MATPSYHPVWIDICPETNQPASWGYLHGFETPHIDCHVSGEPNQASQKLHQVVMQRGDQNV